MKIKSLIKITGIILLLGCFSAYFYAFLSAYYHPSRAVRIEIDKFHEADIEYVISILAVVLGAASLFLVIYDETEKESKFEYPILKWRKYKAR